MVQKRIERAFAVVSPDVLTPVPTYTDDEEVEASPPPTVVLLPMAEWKQCAQRAIRTLIQSFLFLVGGGTIYQVMTGLGIPPASVENLPSTGTPLYDAALYALMFAVVVFVWNWAEFALDVDINAPRWRA